jgi:predicted ABC-type transport system involved in lysophospholipase L1 biosynthesis ATPase subunit
MSVPKLYETFQAQAKAKSILEQQALTAHLSKAPAEQANGRQQLLELIQTARLTWPEVEALALAQHQAGKFPGLTASQVRYELQQLQADTQHTYRA